MPPKRSSSQSNGTRCPTDTVTTGDGAGADVPVTRIESVTGLDKDVIRKWESRYGFPSPGRDENGDRLYPAEQVARLQLIRRLIGAGLRPGRIVGLELPALQEFTESILSKIEESSKIICCDDILEALVCHDLVQVKVLLKGLLFRQGLSTFVRETVASLNTVIGDAWLRGDVKVFEEHIYSEILQSIILESIGMVSGIAKPPRILLTTAPGEFHTIGLSMAHAIFALEGADCLRLGAQTPASEVAAAAGALSIDIVGLSFSLAHPARATAGYLRDLRLQLAAPVELWAGGGGVSRLRAIGGVRFMSDLDKICSALRVWRRRHKEPRAGTPGGEGL